MLVLNFMYMKKNLFRFSSRRILFSTVIASALLAGGSQTVFADAGEVQAVLQAGAIKGKIVDSNGDPVIGANVKVKGTTNGTITDIDGNFALNNVSGGTLTISFIGYKTLEIPVKGTNLARIVMHEDTEVLDEVVVVGYGTMKKESLTGSVAVVDQKIFKDKGTVANPLQAMQGQVPGLRITRSSAAPGEEGWGISIRGAVSKNSTEPLLIIDGVPASGVSEMAQLNTADIESINFLKDASAAIYGSKAAGGVILVTTKKAKGGKPRVEYNGSYTRKKVGLQPRMMSYDEWMDGIIQACYNDGRGDDYTWVRYAKLAQKMKGRYIDLTDGQNPDPIPGSFAGVADFVFMDDVNWTDVLWGGANSTQHDLSISGGTDKNTYRLSAGYLYDEGTLQWGNNSNERFNIRLSNSFKLTERFSVESVMSASRQNQVSPTQIGATLGVSIPQPGFPVSTIDGKPYAWGGQYTRNWQAELGGDNKLVVTAMNVNEQFKYNLMKGLDVNVTLGYSTNSAIRDEQYLSIQWYSYNGNPIKNENSPFPTQDDSSYTKSSARTDNYTAAAFLSYTTQLNEVHGLTAMVGTQYDRTEYEYSSTKAKNVDSTLGVLNGTGIVSIDKVDKWKEAIMSYFGRVNYNYKEKYLIEANARYDGSSKFQPENRWNFFYGFSGGWRITQEPFMEVVRNYVDEIKLRASYGEVGNQSGISRYDGIQLYESVSNAGAYLGDGLTSYLKAGNLVSTERTWERIHNYNLGLDFTALGGRLSGSFELFMKKNNNMLVGKLYPGVLGSKAPDMNSGKFESKGYDGTLTWKDKISDFSYHVGATLTYMENKLISGGENVKAVGYNSALNGYPLNSVFGYRCVGKIQNEEQLKKYKERYLMNNSIGMPANLRLGDNMYEDVNNDGKLSQEDLIYLGSDDPKFSFSFNLGFAWKGVDFSAVLQGVGKRTVYRSIDAWKVPFKAIWLNTTNQSVGNVWSPETPDNYYPTYTNNTNLNDYNYMSSTWSADNGAYLRLKDVVLGYTLPKSVLNKMGNFMTNLRVYVSGSDLWEKSYIHDGWDPEATRKVENKQRYPFNRTFTVGVNATF